MFLHSSGARALWPVIFFLPWLFLGTAYLGEWLLQRRWWAISLPFSTATLRIISLGFLVIIASLALPDPVP